MNFSIKKYLPIALVILNSLLILELLLASTFYFYRVNKHFDFLIPLTKSYYNLVKNIIQFDPACGRVDNELGYTLKPGTCRFDNLEFETAFNINSAGLRDDEASLNNPEILMLGDSYTMGWGVEQNESFASIVEQKTGRKVLNAGISSYGTARQNLLLDRIDTTNLRYLVLQYCDNDFNENKKYIENPSEFVKLTKKYTLKQMAKHMDRSKYTPFKFTRHYFKHMHANITGNIEIVPRDRLGEFQIAMQIISEIRKKIPDAKIIFFEVSGANKNDTQLKSTLELILKLPEFSHLQDKIIVLDMASQLSEEDYFIVDNHINRDGHRKIASLITEHLSLQ